MTKKEIPDTELQDIRTNTAGSLLGAAPLNDSTRAKRPAREKLRMLKAMGGKTRPGYIRRWVMDKRTSSAFGSNIKDKEFLGYTVVENENVDSDKDLGSKIGSVVEKFESDGTRMVLMEIPKDEYDEMQEEKRLARAERIKPASGEGVYENSKIDISYRSEHL